MDEDISGEKAWYYEDFYMSSFDPNYNDFSTPVQSPTPTPSGNNFFSDIVTGIGSAITQAVPQFTSALIDKGATSLLGNNSTYKGGSKVPTTAQQPASLLSNPIVIIGGIVAIVAIGYFALKD